MTRSSSSFFLSLSSFLLSSFPLPSPLLALAFPLFTLSAPTTTSAAADQLILTDGQRLEGKIKSYDGETLHFEAVVGAGTATTRFRRDQIERIAITQTPEEKRLLASHNLADIDPLKTLWAGRNAYLTLPGSDAGAVGHTLGRLLLAQATETSAQTVLKLVGILEAKDWDKSRAPLLASYRIRALLQLKRTDEAIAEAEKMADAVQGGGAEIVEAKFFAAEANTARLRKLEEDFPRWFEIKEKRAERENLYHSILDALLFPVVFQADDPKACVRGLVAAAEIYTAEGDTANAVLRLQEVAHHFPDPEYAARAREMLASLEQKRAQPQETQE